MIEIATEDDELRISYQPGHTGTVVVAFTGIGQQLGALQTEEFRGSLAADDKGNQPSVIFVIDKQRRWYNNGVAARVVQAVNALVDRFPADRVVTLGNSMGGFGALVFARHLGKCDKAIAFCPQSSVNPRVAAFETRWGVWRRHITQWDIEDATLELASHVRYEIFYGMNDSIDMNHAARFEGLAAPNVCLHLVPNCEHNVAAHLKRQQKLKSILHGLMSQEGGNAGQ